MSMAQRDRLDRACLKFERAGSGRAQNSNLLNGPGRAESQYGPGRAEKFRPVHSSSAHAAARSYYF